MKNGYLAFGGILALAAALTFGRVASERPAMAGGACCPLSGKAMTAPAAASMDGAVGQAGMGSGGAAMCGDKCMSGLAGPAKEAYDSYAKKTAALRKELGEARAALAKELTAKSVNSSSALKLADRVSELQGRLYRESVAAYVSMRGTSADASMPEHCLANPIACTMMLSDQCAMMMHGAGMMGMGPGAGCCGMPKGATRAAAAALGAGPTDPVCGMTLTEDTTAASAEHDGKTYYFCNERCKAEFDKDPAKYIK